MHTAKKFLDAATSILEIHRNYRMSTETTLTDPSAVLERLHAIVKTIDATLLSSADLRDSVHYVVLNHVMWNSNRAFVTWLNADIVPQPLRLPTPLDGADDGSAKVFCSGAVDNREQLARDWLLVWFDYLKHTQNLEDTSGTTWNQLLLKYCKCPKTLGLIWDSSGDSPEESPLSVSSPYVHIPALKSVLASSSEECPKPLCPLLPLEKRLLSMQVTLLSTSSLPASFHSLAFTLVSFLYRHYSIWGGSSFLSIPIFHRTLQPNGTSVLSICTRKPLTQNEVVQWSYLATHCFTPLAGDEAHEKLEHTLTLDDLPPPLFEQILNRPLTALSVKLIHSDTLGAYFDRCHATGTHTITQPFDTYRAVLEDICRMYLRVGTFPVSFEALLRNTYRLDIRKTVSDFLKFANTIEGKTKTSDIASWLDGSLGFLTARIDRVALDVLVTKYGFSGLRTSALPNYSLWAPSDRFTPSQISEFRCWLSEKHFQDYLVAVANSIRENVARAPRTAEPRICIQAAVVPDSGQGSYLFIGILNVAVPIQPSAINADRGATPGLLLSAIRLSEGFVAAVFESRPLISQSFSTETHPHRPLASMDLEKHWNTFLTTKCIQHFPCYVNGLALPLAKRRTLSEI